MIVKLKSDCGMISICVIRKGHCDIIITMFGNNGKIQNRKVQKKEKPTIIALYTHIHYIYCMDTICHIQFMYIQSYQIKTLKFYIYSFTHRYKIVLCHKFYCQHLYQYLALYMSYYTLFN